MENIELANGNLEKLWRLTGEAKAEEMHQLVHSSIFDSLSVGAAIVSPSGKFIDVNEIYARMLGMTREELIGMTRQELTPEPYRSIDKALVDSCLRGERDGYILPKGYDKKERDTLVFGTIIVNSIKDAASGVVSFLVLCAEYHPEASLCSA